MTNVKPGDPRSQLATSLQSTLEFYILDEQLRKVETIEGFKSFIWTERYSAYGDFQIDVPANRLTRTLLAMDTLIACSQSTYLMKIETITDGTDDTGAANLKITGRSLEAILDDRVAITPVQMSNLTDNPNWEITGTPGDIVRYIFKTICVDLVVNAGDAIPFYKEGTISPATSTAEPTEIVTVTTTPGSLYEVEKKICDTYGLGFRFVRNGDKSEIYFEVYTGNDRTSAQNTRAAVIFSSDMDNLSNTTKLISKAAYKNVAYVVGKDQVKIVYGVGENTEATGFDRRVITVDASSIDASTVTDVDAALSQKGLEALAAAQKVYQFDGEVSQYGVYRYGVDYKLGDLIEERDNTGFGNQMRVTEQIFVSDAQGDRSYPTLSRTLVIVPGTWSAWKPAGQIWMDVPEKDVWGNQ